jgi:hypothetical protein
MSVHPRPKDEPLPDDLNVYRGMRNRNWVKRGKIQAAAFLRRQDNEPHLSVAEGAEYCVRGLREHFGIAELDTTRVRAVVDEEDEPLGLDVIADPLLVPEVPPEHENPYHAGITGVPPWAPPGTGDEQAALDAAVAIIRCCEPRLL